MTILLLLLDTFQKNQNPTKCSDKKFFSRLALERTFVQFLVTLAGDSVVQLEMLFILQVHRELKLVSSKLINDHHDLDINTAA